jgi:hypothetical protein
MAILFPAFLLAAGAICAVICWRRNYPQGIGIGQAVVIGIWLQFTFRVASWLMPWNYDDFVLYDSHYLLRLWYPWTIRLLPFVDPIYVVALLNGVFWFTAMAYAERWLRTQWGFPPFWSMVGGIMPLITCSTLYYGYCLSDALTAVVVIIVFDAWLHLARGYVFSRRQHATRRAAVKEAFVSEWKWLLVIAGAGFVALFNDYPVKPEITLLTAPIILFRIQHFILLGLTMGAFLIFAAKGGREWFGTDLARWSLWLLPAFALPFIFGVDWCRWAVLAFPLWVPPTLMGIRKWFREATKLSEQQPSEPPSKDK